MQKRRFKIYFTKASFSVLTHLLLTAHQPFSCLKQMVVSAWLQILPILTKELIAPSTPSPRAQKLCNRYPLMPFFFAKLDAVHGYFQLALDEEFSKLTTFLLPEGRFRYLQAPMGLSASSDEWCQKSHFLVEGLPFCKKIVDDILIWSKSPEELHANCKTVLNRCREMNVSISAKKLEFSNSIKFAGHTVSDQGIKPDPSLTDAIRQFPRSTNLTELRSFVALANQLASFLPDLAKNTAQVRKLLSPQNAFLWLPEHEQEFLKTKEILTSKLIAKPFDVNLPTILITDASRLNRMGFPLIQKEENNNIRLIQCGLKSLTPCQQNYATIELECLAIFWAVNNCKFFLNGAKHFQSSLITRHLSAFSTSTSTI